MALALALLQFLVAKTRTIIGAIKKKIGPHSRG